MKQLYNNPVMNKEFKLRFRTEKSFLGIFFYLFALGLIGIGFIYMQTLTSQYGYFRPDESRIMFYVLSYLQLVLLLFTIPGLTAGVISGEREKQTLNILLTTTQSSLSIVFGKLFSSLSYLLILMISSLPLYSFVFLFGGISPFQLVSVFLIYILTIFSLGSVSVYFSTIIRKTIVSTIIAYGVMLFLALGTALLFGISISISTNWFGASSSHPIPYLFAVLNPFMVMLSVFEPSFSDQMNKLFFNIDLPLWIPYTILYLLMFFLSMMGSVKRLRPNMKQRK